MIDCTRGLIQVRWGVCREVVERERDMFGMVGSATRNRDEEQGERTGRE